MPLVVVSSFCMGDNDFVGDSPLLCWSPVAGGVVLGALGSLDGTEGFLFGF